MSTRRSVVLRASIVIVGVVCAGVFAGGGGGGGNCCFTQTCGSQSVEDCTGSACASNERCTGSGGCTPAPWADAKCERKDSSEGGGDPN
jgi:hypothetical protein